MQFFKSRITLLLSIILISSVSYSQVNSPYSRYGLGNLFPFTFEASNGFAGISAPYFSNTNINFGNPSSYADISNALFEIGGNASVLTLQTADEHYTGGDGNLSYLAFGFPYLKKLRNQQFGLSFGLLPYSSFQYNIFENTDTGDPQLGTQENNYVGNGDLYRFYGGTGIEIKTDTNEVWRVKNKDTILNSKDSMIAVRRMMFGLGGNISYLFGTLTNATYASFPDQVNSQTTKLFRENAVGGLTYNFGGSIKWTSVIEKKYLSTWALGISYEPSLTVEGLQSVVWTNILKNGNYEFVTDTLYVEPDTSGNITLPSTYKVGLSYSFISAYASDSNQFSIFAEYAVNNWSEYRGFQSTGTLVDNWRVSIGAEFLPKTHDKNKAPVIIRGGFYLGTNYLSIDGVQLKENGGTIGFGIPIANGISRINLSANIGTRGTTDVIKETYYRFGIGFTLVDTGWFRPFKLN